MEFGFVYFYLHDDRAPLRNDFRGAALMAIIWYIILLLVKRCSGVIEKVGLILSILVEYCNSVILNSSKENSSKCYKNCHFANSKMIGFVKWYV